MKNSDSNNSHIDYEAQRLSPLFGGPRQKPGSGVFGLCIALAIILAIMLVIFFVGRANRNADESPLQTQEQQEAVDEMGFDNTDDFSSQIFSEAGVELVQFGC